MKNDELWDGILKGEGEPAVVDGIALWISPRSRTEWHAAMHVGVSFEECLICHDDRTLYKEMCDTRQEDDELDEALDWDEEDEDDE